jgi:hypothetical protein
MTILPASARWSALRCADPICHYRNACLRFIDIEHQSTPHPVAGSLMPIDQSPAEPCPWYLDPEAEAGA